MEYILLAVVVVTTMVAIWSAINTTRGYFWKEMTCQVAAPCPDCPVSESVKFRMSRYPGQCK